MTWKSQLVEGRVFELRTQSKKYPPPCGLILNASAGRADKFMTAVDQCGVIGNGLYQRSHNPDIYVDGIRADQFTSRRIARRRRDLERFDSMDMALIRSGYALDFEGRITAYPEPHIPLVIPAGWTVFWLRAWHWNDYRWINIDHTIERQLFRGAWWFSNLGGCRRLGYKFGQCWATRHTGRRLKAIRDFLRASFPDLIEQQTRVVRWNDSEGRIYTTEIRRECPALGSTAMYIENPNGFITGVFR